MLLFILFLFKTSLMTALQQTLLTPNMLHVVLRRKLTSQRDRKSIFVRRAAPYQAAGERHAARAHAGIKQMDTPGLTRKVFVPQMGNKVAFNQNTSVFFFFHFYYFPYSSPGLVPTKKMCHLPSQIRIKCKCFIVSKEQICHFWQSQPNNQMHVNIF